MARTVASDHPATLSSKLSSKLWHLLCVLVIICTLGIQVGNSCNGPNAEEEPFQYLLLRLEWPAAHFFARGQEPKNYRDWSRFTIHGLWLHPEPWLVTGYQAHPEYYLKRETIYDISQILEINKLWPALKTNPTPTSNLEFWLREWQKHGTSVSHYTRIATFKKPFGYFNWVVNKGRRFNWFIDLHPLWKTDPDRGKVAFRDIYLNRAFNLTFFQTDLDYLLRYMFMTSSNEGPLVHIFCKKSAYQDTRGNLYQMIGSIEICFNTQLAIIPCTHEIEKKRQCPEEVSWSTLPQNRRSTVEDLHPFSRIED